MKNNSLEKKIIALLLCVVMASFFMPAFSFADDGNDELEHDGYLVVVKDGTDVDTKNSDIEEVVEDEIYVADSVSDIKEEIPAQEIEYIEPNYVMELCDEYMLNDNYYDQAKWAQEIMNVQKAWNRGYFGNYSNSSGAPTVAIIDTGIVGTGSGNELLRHEDLNYDNVSAGKNTIKDNLNTNDDNGHGTFIAGIISAVHNNALGIAGDMPNLKVKAYKCADKDGKATLGDEIEAIYAAIEDSVDVMNISLGMLENSSIEQEAINAATEKGIIVCASSGNDGERKLNYPASCENVISVGSIDSSMKKSSFSQYNKMVDCIAPGEEIISLGYSKSDGYMIGGGTSFSTPQVAALAAMCKSVDPSINHDKFMELLKSTSKDAGNDGYDTAYGWGIIDFGNMLDALAPKDNSIWAADITGISSEAKYTGSAITFDNLKITMPNGTELTADSDYKVSYYNNIKSAVGMLTIEGIGSYTGRINKYFNVNGASEKQEEKIWEWFSSWGKKPTNPDPEPIIEPEPTTPSGGSGSGGNGGGGTAPAPSEPTSPAASDKISEEEPVIAPKISISKVKAGKKSFTITWDKKSVDGYKIQYGTSKSFKKKTYKTKMVKKNKTSCKIKNLKSKKKYYIRMRAYISKEGSPYWSDWTATKTVKTK